MLRYRSSSTYNQLLIAHILISILMSTIFIKYLPPGRPILDWSQNWKCSEFIEIWHIWYFEYPNLGFDVKVIFIKYLSPVWHKLVPKLEVLRIYWNLVINISNMPILILLSKILFFIKYLPIARPQLIPKWKMLRIYWDLAELIFPIC